MEPPPVATALAFHPRHNSIFVIGMDDATIQIYDGRLGQVKYFACTIDMYVMVIVMKNVFKVY